MDREHKGALKKAPPIGMRMIKSVAAVFLCFLIGMIRGSSGDVYQSVISTLFCIQEHVNDSKEAAFNRIGGTLIGAIYGAIAVLVHVYIFPEGTYEGIAGYVFIAVMIIPVIYTTILLKQTNIAYFSCVVFLTIAMGRINQPATIYIFNRVLDTFIGVFVAIGVNTFKLPHKYHNNILFVANLDDTLLNMNESLSPYSKIELNKMIEEGAMFSLSTDRTPASLIEVISEIKLRLPVIAMDGSVLYDIGENQYLKVYVISPSTVEKLLHFAKTHKFNCFTNAIVGDIMLTYCQRDMTEIEEELYRKYKKSPYRHYVKGDLPPGQDAIYLMFIGHEDEITQAAQDLEKKEYAGKLKIAVRESEEFPGFYHLRIYNRNASKENMIEYMKEHIGAQRVITFGSRVGEADIVVDHNDTNEVVKTMKQLYKPLWFKE